FEFNDNTITTDSDGIFFEGWEKTFYLMAPGTDATMGSMQFNNNTIEVAEYGIYLDLYFESTTLRELGDILILDNVMSTAYGLYISEIYFYRVVPGTNIVVGDLLIQNNHVEATEIGYYGIDVDFLAAEGMNGGSLTWGDIIICDNNTIIASGGIYLYGTLYNLTDVAVNIGALEISRNNVSTNEMEGIYLDWWDIGSLFGTTSIVFGPTKVNNNTIVSTDDGIYVL
ncbi:MAG: hypothetical protein QCI38_09305, partial [Candidatus Thermoplasmatota archaeon]|nr:hypothetical protein [Candidatus Thermoplasmatota archaeon]